MESRIDDLRDRPSSESIADGEQETDDQAILEVEDLAKNYGRTKALDGLSVSLGRGEFVALLGPNGAGKTTLFQLLTGLFLPERGTIRIAGWDMRRDPVPALARIGIVFQQPTLDLDRSVRANLRFHARLHGMSGRAERRIAAELQRLGITDQASTVCRKLSGGNRRRVELARALIHEPEILLMDEPTVGLDPASRRDLLAHVRRLAAEHGIAVLWATHLVDEVEEANRLIILHRGRIVACGAPREMAGGIGSIEDSYLKLTAEKGDRS